MLCLLGPEGQQQPFYWLCRINPFLSFTGKVFSDLRRNVKIDNILPQLNLGIITDRDNGLAGEQVIVGTDSWAVSLNSMRTRAVRKDGVYTETLLLQTVEYYHRFYIYSPPLDVFVLKLLL